ncbi:hypothetical protein [Nostocoides sp. HKS02]|uniref:hypothetical protein n=1 Tax=Nostocoides sp. HKS02 TaxID=1813880 RepID=UPI0012B4F37D|nr:hypothetical protein [Tetrasphaera sp. HKS02]QGN56895.1 hypothetical protein GKE56_02185 [Tetrasphaera sp. HKS02]
MARSHALVRAALALASLALLGLTVAAATSPVWLVVAVLVGLTGYAVVRPGSHAVTVLLAGHALHWMVVVPLPGGMGRWLALLGGAWLGLALHLTAALAATLPAAAPVPAATLARWARRGLTVALLVVPLWALAAVAGLQHVAGQLPLTYAAIAGVGLLALSVWLVSRDPRS